MFANAIASLQIALAKPTTAHYQFEISSFNADTYLSKTIDHKTRPYQMPSDTLLYDSSNMFYGLHSGYEQLDFILNNYEVFNTFTDKYQQPLLLPVYTLNRTNITYYQPMEIGTKFDYTSSALFIKFKIGPVVDITQIFALTDDYGQIYAELIHVYETHQLLFVYYDGTKTQQIVVTALDSSLYTIYNMHLFSLTFDMQNNSIIIHYALEGGSISSQTIILQNYQNFIKFKYFHLGLMIDNDTDRFDTNTIKHIVAYDTLKYPNEYLSLFSS
jgi:hypothetical protein